MEIYTLTEVAKRIPKFKNSYYRLSKLKKGIPDEYVTLDFIDAVEKVLTSEYSKAIASLDKQRNKLRTTKTK